MNNPAPLAIRQKYVDWARRLLDEGNDLVNTIRILHKEGLSLRAAANAARKANS